MDGILVKLALKQKPMHTYKAIPLDLPELKGLSEKQITVHIGLYEGYVKHVNLLREQIRDLTALDKEKYAFSIMETRRRLGFEFDGMRMHEYYFNQFEKGSAEMDRSSKLAAAVSEKYGSWEEFLEHLTTVGMTRGIGWTVLYADPKANTVHTTWVGDHELGQLAGLPIILAMDMWEHAFMVDYLPSEKKQYIGSFLANINWDTVNERFDA
jgi:Fe-Mn family superoxide dismutase